MFLFLQQEEKCNFINEEKKKKASTSHVLSPPRNNLLNKPMTFQFTS